MANANVTTLDTSGLENTFQAVGTAMNQIARQQQIANDQLNQSLLQQQQERGQIVAVMDKVASATLQSSYDSIFTSIPVYDGSDTKEFWSWLHRIEAACSYTKRNPRLEAMGKSTGKVLSTIMSIPQNYPWSILRRALVREFSEFTSPAHATAALDNMQQEEGEPLKLYVHRYSVIHKMVTGMDAIQNTDPSRWMSFLRSINNIAISNKISKSKTIPHNLEQCMTRAIQMEAQYQFAEGVNLGRRTGPTPFKSVMIQEMIAENDDEDANPVPRNDRASRNACWICGEVGHYANECPHNLSNMKNKGGKKTSMDKKGAEYSYTISGKEPMSERLMNTVLNGMMRERRSRLQVQHKYQRLKKAVTTNENEVAAAATAKVTAALKTTAAAATPAHQGHPPQDDKKKNNANKKSESGSTSKGNDKNKNNREATPRKQCTVKSEPNLGPASAAAATPAIMRHCGRQKTATNDDTNEIQSGTEDLLDEEDFLEELFDTSEESMSTSETSSEDEESTQ